MSATLAILLLATPARADVSGPARIIDGDTLKVDGEVIRLHGIDAPEKNQPCFIDGKRWQCGKDAANILADFINNRSVTCEDLGRDRHKRIIGRCTVAGEDLVGEWMVANGWAVAYYLYSYEYSRAEHGAKSARHGIWASEFVKPWEWRRGKRLAANDNVPTLCQIKGNINARGERIYHMPSQPAYNVTRINPAKGERWFCSEAEARAAGWRKEL